MAKVNYISLAPGQADLYKQGLKPGDRFVYSRVTKTQQFYGREKVAQLARRSYLPLIKTFWDTLTPTEKLAWKTAGAERGITSWQAFVADQSQRIKFGLAGMATPSTLHQDYVGFASIESPATELKIQQTHPNLYYIYQKVQGTRSQYDPVAVEEKFYLPIELKINAKTDLTSAGAGAFAKFIADITHFYQGVTWQSQLEISIPLSQNWTQQSVTKSTVRGEVSIYTLYLHLYNVTGTILFDNPRSLHSAQNWTRDPYCKRIDQSFTRAYYQVEKAWAPVIFPAGAEYYSIYPD